MKALVFHGPGQKAWEEKPRPVLKHPADAIVKVTTTTICGTDLHILKGDVPTVVDGRVLGHEAVGVIEELGSAVTGFKVGEHVIVSCITACGQCPECKKGLLSHCVNGGWILGNLIDGTQAEYVRVPYADHSLHRVPPGVDEEAMVMLSDILPTGFEVGVLNGAVKPGDTVAIVGAGPIGLAALMTAQFYSPAEIIMIDLDENRLAAAKKLGATQLLNSRDGKAVEHVLERTKGRGVDVAIEAVGIAATFDLCQDLVCAGGHLANVGVHGKSVMLKLEKLWTKNVTITTGLVDTRTTPMLLKTVVSGKLKPRQLITHEFKFDQFLEAYETFGNASVDHALKVVLRA